MAYVEGLGWALKAFVVMEGIGLWGWVGRDVKGLGFVRGSWN